MSIVKLLLRHGIKAIPEILNELTAIDVAII